MKKLRIVKNDFPSMQLQIWQPSGKGDETDISEVMKITTACNLDWPEVVQLSKRCGSLGGRVLRECITSPHHILQILGVFKCLNILNIFKYLTYHQ